MGAKPDPETRHSILIGILSNSRTSSFPPTAHYKECNRDAEIHLERQGKGMHSNQCHGCQGSCEASVCQVLP